MKKIVLAGFGIVAVALLICSTILSSKLSKGIEVAERATFVAEQLNSKIDKFVESYGPKLDAMFTAGVDKSIEALKSVDAVVIADTATSETKAVAKKAGEALRVKIDTWKNKNKK